jgi:hypothetical protein
LQSRNQVICRLFWKIEFACQNRPYAWSCRIIGLSLNRLEVVVFNRTSMSTAAAASSATTVESAAAAASMITMIAPAVESAVVMTEATAAADITDTNDSRV